MTRTCWTAPGAGATVKQLADACPSTPSMALLLVKAAMNARPGTRWEELLPMRTNVVLLGGQWGPEDLERIERLEVMT